MKLTREKLEVVLNRHAVPPIQLRTEECLNILEDLIDQHEDYIIGYNELIGLKAIGDEPRTEDEKVMELRNKLRSEQRQRKLVIDNP